MNFIFINPNSRGGHSLALWQKIKPHLTGQWQEIVTSSVEELHDKVRKLQWDGEAVLASASGDGGVNELINAIMALDEERRNRAMLGAVGLGSSNDFHKPLKEESKVAGIFTRLNANKSSKHDLGLAQITLKNGKVVKRYFIINASTGVTAKGNHYFNSGKQPVKFLKRIHVEIANLFTIFHLLKNLKADEFHLKFQDESNKTGVDQILALTNLGILKKNHVSGGMKYDTPVTSRDGMFDVVTCGDMGRLEIIKVIIGLYQGKFIGQAKTSFWRAKQLTVSAPQAFYLETDGEVTDDVISVTMEVVPQIINVCE